MSRHFLGIGCQCRGHSAQPAAALGSLGQRLEEAVSCFAGAQCHLTIGGKKKLQGLGIAKLFSTWAVRLPSPSAPDTPTSHTHPQLVDGSAGEEAETLEAEVPLPYKQPGPHVGESETAGWILLVRVFSSASCERENENHVQGFWSVSVSKHHSCLLTTPKTSRPS